MPTLILEPQTEADFRLFVELAKRLQTPYRREDTRSAEEREAAFLALAGSLDTPETGDELNAFIKGSAPPNSPGNREAGRQISD